MGIHLHGLALIDAGRVAEGMALLDEAMASALAGELGTFYTGVVYCNVIAACLEVSDVGRLGEWNEAARQWCESLPPDAPFPAFCRVNRAEAASLRGAWPEAEAEASRASQELGFNPRVAARAFYETGEVRRRVGDLAGAEEAFARAHELGFRPQPGLALLRLAQGKPDAAMQALRVALADEPAGLPRRARLLAALVEVALAAGDLDAAGQASRELDEIAGRLGTPRWMRRRRPRAGRCGSPRAICRGPWSACAPPARPGRSCGCPTRPRRRGCCTAARCAAPAARRTPCWSCARPWPPSSGSAPPATRPRRPRCSAGGRSCPAG
jgi:tetratricopeptide (TPR) repeat protein